MQSETEEQAALTTGRCHNGGIEWKSLLRGTILDGFFIIGPEGAGGTFIGVHLPSGDIIRGTCSASGMEIFRPSVNPVYHYDGIFEPHPTEPGQERVHGTRERLIQPQDQLTDPQDPSLAALLAEDWIAEKGGA